MASIQAATLFNELYVDYIKSIFFDNPSNRFTVELMQDSVFEAIRDPDVVNAVIHVLLMRKVIEHLPEKYAGHDWYQASAKAIDEYNKDRELDKKIKVTTKENLVAQRWPLKWWPLISLATIAFSALASYLVAINSGTTQPPVTREQTQQTIQPRLRPDTQINSLRDSL